MKCKVRLSYALEMIVEAESEDVVIDWLRTTTPMEAKNLANDSYNLNEDYDEEIICNVRDNSAVDYVIK